jgi:glycosyltransferase involved in cell wall biosynthesis
MKLISVLIPTFNEVENVKPLSEEIIRVFNESLSNYRYEIIFIDNCSTDGTQEIIRQLCSANKNIKAIFNAKNFGPCNSPYYGLLQASGDCVIGMSADFQEPVDMLPLFVKEWENGYKMVCGIKEKSKENFLMYLLRSIFYKLIKKMSNVEQIEHFTGFGLYDKSFIEVMRNLNDPTPYLRGIVTELGPKRKLISFTQEKRRFGKSKINWYGLYDVAMLSFTSYTKVGLRIATITGFIFSALGLLSAFVYLVLKLMFWYSFPAGMIPVLIGVFVLGSLQLFFIGLVGEYIMNINSRIMNRPLVIEETRINFDD